MNARDRSTQAPAGFHVSTLNTSDKHLASPWLLIARIGWGTTALLSLLLFAISVPAYFAGLHVVCPTENTVACHIGRITRGNAVALTHLNISVDVYAAYILAITLFASVIFLAVGTLIFWRKSQEAIGLFTSLLLITWGCCGPTSELPEALAAAHPASGMLHIINKVAFILYPAVGMFFCLFPNGRFVPRWSWLLIGLWFLTAFYFDSSTNSPFSVGNSPPIFLAAVLLLSLGTSLSVQIYRYRFVSDAQQRLQTRWFVFMCALAVLLNLLYRTIGALLPAFAQPNSLYQLAAPTVTVFVFLLIPLGIGIAILRSHLWNIDILINRTLVYGVLTVILTGVYVGLVIGLQALLQGIISQDTSVAIVISTLAIVVLFQPLHRRIQRIIDRRFYRSKYDAAKTVAAFSATLRHEVDLDQLREHLLDVVQKTMQPAHVSLWLRKDEQPGKQSTDT